MHLRGIKRICLVLAMVMCFGASLTVTPAATLSAPEAPAIESLQSYDGKLTVSWCDVEGASGYQITCSDKEDFNTMFSRNTIQRKVDDPSEEKCTLRGLKRGKTYYVKVQAYRSTEEETCYSDCSNVMTIQIAK